MAGSVNELEVQVLSPARPLARVKAKSVQVPGAEGYMEIGPGHAPLVSELDVGFVKVSKSAKNEDLNFFVVGGYVDVSGEGVRVLATVAETADEIDRKRAEEAKRRAEERLAKSEKGVDLNRAQTALFRALARIDFIDNYLKK